MDTRAKFTKVLAVVGLALTLGWSVPVHAGQLGDKQNRSERRTEALSEEVRHQLVTMPYYSVFDWLEAQVKPDGTVTLMGQVSQPTIKNDAEWRVKRLEGATQVVNNIEVLPLSPMDDQVRLAVYRAIYTAESPLFRYAMQAVGPIHILVKNGHVTLKGVVRSQSDKQLAYMAANGVSGVFSVENNLRVEEQTPQAISQK